MKSSAMLIRCGLRIVPHSSDGSRGSRGLGESRGSGQWATDLGTQEHVKSLLFDFERALPPVLFLERVQNGNGRPLRRRPFPLPAVMLLAARRSARQPPPPASRTPIFEKR